MKNCNHPLACLLSGLQDAYRKVSVLPWLRPYVPATRNALKDHLWNRGMRKAQKIDTGGCYKIVEINFLG